MKRRGVWMSVGAFAVGVAAITCWNGDVRADGQKPVAEQKDASEQVDLTSAKEPGGYVPEDATTVQSESERVENQRVSPPIQMAAQPFEQQELASESGTKASAQPPILVNASSQLSFQALLTDASGDPLPDGNVDLAFRIYRGATLVEGPIPVTAAVVNGVVDTLVPVTNTSFDGGSRQLSVTLVNPAAGELLPRIQLGAVPYAFRVDRVASSELDDFIELGSAGGNGNLKVWDDAADNVGVELDGDASSVVTYGDDGLEQTKLWGPSWGELLLHGRSAENNVGARLAVPSICLSLPPNPCTWIDYGGQLQLYDNTGAQKFLASAPTTGGQMQVYNEAGAVSARLLGQSGDYETLGSFDVMDTLGGENRATMFKFSGGGRMQTRDENNRSTVLIGSSNVAGGFLEIYQQDGGLGMNVDGDANGNDGGGVLRVYQADGSTGVIVDGDDSNNNTGGSISIYNDSGGRRIFLQGDEGDAGQILMYNATGTQTIEIDSDWGGTGNGRGVFSEVQITGGADLSEQFDIAPCNGQVEPGMVVSIDPKNPGKLLVSGKAYDRTVAGVISGAGGVRPGMYVGQRDSEANGAHAVALTGRVYCWCDASNGSIQAGDLLTTSNTPGHAMKVTDHTLAQGAIIGKAMTSLESGKGLVLVLVSLQ